MNSKEPRSFKLESKSDDAERFSIRPSYLMFAAFASTTLLYSPNVGILTRLSEVWLVPWFVYPMFISCFIVSLFTMLYAAAHTTWRCFSYPLLALATLLYIGGTLLFYVLIQMQEAYEFAALVAGVCMGCGLVPVAIAWGVELALPLKRALFVGSFICLVACLASWGLYMLPLVVLRVAYPILIFLGAGTPLIKLIRQRSKSQKMAEVPEKDEYLSAVAEPVEKQSVFANMRNLLSITWIPFIGLLLYAYLTAVQKLRLFEVLDSEFLGGALAALCILCLCFVKIKKPLLPLVCRVFVPIAIAILVITGSFPSESLTSLLGGIGMYIFFIFLALFAVSLHMAVTFAGEFTPTFIYGFVLVCGTVVSLLGLFFSHIVIITEDFRPIMWVVTCLFFAAIIIFLGISSWKSLVEPDEAVMIRDLSFLESLSQKCEMLVARYKLSPREEEILSYLSRGHNPTYIAKTLFISVHTARSHVRNIYRKIGVGSREELLQLIDDEKI